MDPATIALIGAIVREVGIPAARSIAGRVRPSHPDMAQAIEDVLSRSDATHDDTIATARREQGKG